MNYKITDLDIKNLKIILNDNYSNLSMTQEYIDHAYKLCQETYNSELQHFDLLYRAESKELIKFYNYFLEKSVNPFICCEEQLIKKSQSSALLNFFRKGLDDDKHIISDDKIKDLIEHFRHINRADFDNLIKISLKSIEPENKVKNFLKVIEKYKRFKFSALDEEKIAVLFDKKIPEEQKNIYKQQLLKFLPSLSKDNYFTEDSGFYYNIKINCNILSKTNRVNPSTTEQALSLFFNDFKKYLNCHKENNLNIKDIKIERNQNDNFQIIFSFYNNDKFDYNKSVINKLLKHCLSEDGKQLVGNTKIDDSEGFFNSFLIHESMSQNLNEKTSSRKKSKI